MLFFSSNFNLLLFFLCIQLYTSVSPMGSNSTSNSSFKCEENNMETSLVIGESVDLAFEDNNMRHHNLSFCKWVFKPLHARNYVELYVRSLKEINCRISYIIVYISNGFFMKICKFESIRGFKFIGSDISLKHSCSNLLRCKYKLKVTLRETSPVYAGCDFKMTEAGYRYYLMYNLGDSQLKPLDQVREESPLPGMVIDHVNLSFVNRENPGVTACYLDKIILPREDVPSCHSSTDENCEWEIGKGVEKVQEVLELKGTQWKIRDKGLFWSKPKSLQLTVLCLYIEYLLDNAERALVKVFGHLPGLAPVLIAQKVLSGNVWLVKRITAELPLSIRNKRISLSMNIILRGNMTQTDGSIYINKIYGCNPFSKEDHILISAETSTMLYGSFGKETFELQPLCSNGGKSMDIGCVCPVGFTGNHCQHSCGDNRFGHDCGSKCSLFNIACKNVIFCDDYLGCSCAPGFKGPYCQTECGDGQYGANCAQMCGECLDKKICDRYKGHCFSGCKKGYNPPECTMKLLHFIKPPQLKQTPLGEVTIETVVNESSTAGYGKPLLYEIQLMLLESENSDWQHGLRNEISYDNRIKETVSNLKPDTEYKLRIILWPKPDLRGYDGDEVPSITFHTPCRDSLYKIKAFGIKTNEASVSWKEMDGHSGCKVQQFLLTLISGSNSKKFLTNTLNYTFKNLQPNTIYTVKMKPLLKSNSPFYSVKFITLKSCSDEEDLNLEILFVESRMVGLKWDLNSAQKKNFTVKYKCQRVLSDEAVDCSKDANEFFVSTNYFNITNLYPFRNYSASVKANEDCGLKNSITHFSTKEAVPYSKPTNGRIIEIHPYNVTIFWSRPDDCSECNGHITGYHVEVKSSSSLGHNATISVPRMVVKGLLPNKNYSVHVYYQNSAGWNSTAYLKINFTTPRKIRI